MGRHSEWTEEQERIALSMRNSKFSYTEIADELGKSKQSVASKVASLIASPQSQEAMKAYRKKWHQNRKAVVPGGGRFVQYAPPADKNVPRCVLDERDRAFAEPLTLSATLLGDPPPGRSALDQMARG